MTRRLEGFRSRGSTALASVSLAVTLACGGVVIGCGGGDNGGGGASLVDSGGGQDSGGGGQDSGGGGQDAKPTDTGAPTDAGGGGGDADSSTLKQLAPPTFAPPSGAVDPGSVTILPGAGTPDGGTSFILYTTDGTLPTRSSSAYSGPIQITGNTTIHAFVVSPGFTDSAIATASYTVTLPEAGTLAPPKFNPTSQTAVNDFLVGVSSGPATTICYTLDGVTTPTCNANGACTGSSQPYNSAAQIQINGTITNANTGVVTVQAIACQANAATTAVVSQQYTLIAAPPQMVQPAPGTLPFQEAAGAEVAYTPTVNSVTNGASIWYTTGSNPPPSCITGTKVASPHTFGGSASPTDGLLVNTTYQAISCKQGYAPSPVTTNPYVIQLNQPAFPLATVGVGAPGTYDQAVAAFFMTDTNADVTTTANEWECYTTDGSAPSCGATQKTCGETAATALTFHPNQTIPSITKTGTVLSVVSCNLGFAGSTVQQGTYVLQLDQPDLDLPGIDQTGTTPTNLPITTFKIPAANVTTPATFTPNVEQDVLLGPGGGQPYGFACAILNGTPVCGNGACTTGLEVIGGASSPTGGVLADGNTLIGPLPAAVAPGDTWTVIGCPSTADFGNFLPSLPTTVAYSGPGAAPAPAITPPTGLFFTTQNPVISNNDTNGVTLCYTTDGTVPTCTPVLSSSPGGDTCNNTANSGTAITKPLTGVGATDTKVAQILVTNGGSGYTSPPAVALSGGGFTTAATAAAQMHVDRIAVVSGGSGYTVPVAVSISGGGGATATAAVTGGVITSVTITNAGSGYTGPVTVGFSGGAGSGATATATFAVDTITTTDAVPGGAGYTSAPTVAISGNGGTGATATASLSNVWVVTDIENTNTKVQATVCNASETAPAAVSQTYSFQMAEPDFTAIINVKPVPGTDFTDDAPFTGTIVGAIGSLNTNQTLGAGSKVTLTTTSFFPSNTVVIYYTWDGTPATCGSANHNILFAPSDTADVIWTVPVPATGTTVTLNAVACSGLSTSAEATSTMRSVTYNVVTADPIISTDQIQPNCQTLDANGYGCPGQPVWENDVGVELTSMTPNATLCWTLNGATPVCTLGSNTVSALGGCSTTNNKTLSIQTSGTPVKAIACAGSLPNSNVVQSPGAGQAFTLNVTPVVATPAPGAVTATCNTPVTLQLDQSSNAVNLGGPTHQADFCWTLDGTPPACDGSGTSDCLRFHTDANVANTTYGTGAAGSNSRNVNLSGNIRTITCSPPTPRVYNGASQSFAYNLPGYKHTNGGAPAIVVDGSVADWTAPANYAAGEDIPMSDSGGNTNQDKGYFTYDNTNLYFAVSMNDFTPNSTRYVAVYIGNGNSTGGAPNTPASMGAFPLPTDQGITYMFQWQSNPGTTAPVAQVWNAPGNSAIWSAVPAVTVAHGFSVANNTVEFSIPISQLPLLGTSLSTITVIESVVSGVGGTPATDEWTDLPSTSGTDPALFEGFRDAYGSCQLPNQQLFCSGC